MNVPALIDLATRINAEHAAASAAFNTGCEHALRCGRLLIQAKETVQHGEWLPWLKSHCEVSERTAQLFMRLAREVPKLEPEKAQRVADLSIREAARLLTAPGSPPTLQSKSVEHYTPAKYLDAARAVLGSIDLDPASCARANEIVGADKFYSAEDDGLQKPWAGNVWLNPPYCGLAGDFIAKLAMEYEAGNVVSAIVLVNAHATDTAWFAPLWNGHLCFTDHRINFYGDGDRGSPTHGSAIVYFGKHPERFAETFSQFGPVVARWQV